MTRMRRGGGERWCGEVGEGRGIGGRGRRERQVASRVSGA